MARALTAAEMAASDSINDQLADAIYKRSLELMTKNQASKALPILAQVAATEQRQRERARAFELSQISQMVREDQLAQDYA